MEIVVQQLEKRFFFEKELCFFAQIAYPVAQEAPAFTQAYHTVAEALLAQCEAYGIPYGRKKREAYLATGGKRSRFSAPRFSVLCTCKEKKEGVLISFVATVLWQKEILFSKSSQMLWDPTLTFCYAPKKESRSRKGGSALWGLMKKRLGFQRDGFVCQ